MAHNDTHHDLTELLRETDAALDRADARAAAARRAAEMEAARDGVDARLREIASRQSRAAQLAEFLDDHTRADLLPALEAAAGVARRRRAEIEQGIAAIARDPNPPPAAAAAAVDAAPDAGRSRKSPRPTSPFTTGSSSVAAPPRAESASASAAAAPAQDKPTKRRFKIELAPDPDPDTLAAAELKAKVTRLSDFARTDRVNELLEQVTGFHETWRDRWNDPGVKGVVQATIGTVASEARLIQDMGVREGHQESLIELFQAMGRVTKESWCGRIPQLQKEYGGDFARDWLEWQRALAEEKKFLRAVEERSHQQAAAEPEKGRAALAEYHEILQALPDDADPLAAPHSKRLQKQLRIAVTNLGDADPSVLDAAALLPELREGDSVLQRISLPADVRAAAEHDDDHAGVDAVDGPWRGQRVLLYGGTPREERRAKLEKVFGISIEWPEAGGGKSVKRNVTDAFGERIRRGEWPVVLYIVPLCSHGAFYAFKDACADAKVTFRPLRSYGTGQIRQALEETFGK